MRTGLSPATRLTPLAMNTNPSGKVRRTEGPPPGAPKRTIQARIAAAPSKTKRG